MKSASNNVFLRLHKWAKGQDENFLTESLAVVLERLLDLAPVIGKSVLFQLTDGLIGLPSEDAETIEINTQVEEELGRIDLDIRAPRKRVWVEVKVEFGIGLGQLEKYLVMLGEKKGEKNRLVLLTQYFEDVSSTCPKVCTVRWFQFADWLEREILSMKEAAEGARFLMQQFFDFLGSKGMTLVQVGKSMPEGVRALSNLMNLLLIVAEDCGESPKRAPGWGFMGIILDERKYIVSVEFTDPEMLWFGTRCVIDHERALNLVKQREGDLEEVNWVPGRYRWWKGLNLASEDVHFFDRPKDSQRQRLKEFLQDCLRLARSITTKDQPTSLNEPEEN